MRNRVARHLEFVSISIAILFALTGCNSCSIGKTDKVAPTVPARVAITALSATSEIKLSWQPSTDDSGKVKGYKVYKDGKYMKTVETTSVSDAGLSPKVKICYRISAIDEAGNESAQGPEACAIL